MKQINDDFTRQPIPKLIRNLAIPASVGISFQTLYNVTDTWFGGLISGEALAALSLSFPVFFIIISISSGLQTGTTALIGNALGSNKREEAIVFASQGLSFGLIASLILTPVGLFTSPFLFKILGASNGYLDLSMAYIRPIIIGIVFYIVNACFNAVLISNGDTKSYRNVLMFGCILNFGFDPWFMFGGFGLPAMGLAGVAWATVIIQAMAMLYLYVKAIGTGLLSFSDLSVFIPKKAIYKEIARQGLPAGFSMMTVALGIFVITWFFARFGKSAVAAYGIATRIEQIVLMPTIGLNTATLTIAARNNGAGLINRVREVTNKSWKYGFWLLCLGGFVVFLFAENMMSFFTDDQSIIEVGVGYLKIASFILPSYPLLYVSVACLQGLKRPAFALWIGLYRQIAAPLVAFYLLAYALNMGIKGVWWGIFLVTWSATVISVVYVLRVIAQVERDS